MIDIIILVLVVLVLFIFGIYTINQKKQFKRNYNSQVGVINALRSTNAHLSDKVHELYAERDLLKMQIKNNDIKESNFNAIFDEVMDDNKKKAKTISSLKRRIRDIGIDTRTLNPVGHQYKIGDTVYFKHEDKTMKRKITGITIEVFESEYDVYYQFQCKKTLIEKHENEVFLNEEILNFFN